MADVLKYGDKVHIQNGYKDWNGGYLDTNGRNPGAGSVYGVSTSDTPTRAAGTGTWEITSAAGKRAGEQVMSGEVVHLRNLYGEGGYLDTNGVAASGQGPAAKYDVSTNGEKDRGGHKTGSWRVFAQTSSPGDQAVRVGDVVLLWNLYSATGSFLETNGGNPAPTGAKYDVCTSAYWNRAEDVGNWRFAKA
ncbi:hypothetical protein [Streptomyces sp. H27-D2]|uniref:hypothetical protein n=1 Tax=Streptomyces sp. H27-D2 TaxID=3046304 RepID=UPI002DBBF17B|nr:hypothetical protein [Streptomyces sp. H27-D2]MEC4020066.1 hypothetical protein [Streptomyces sp. H27-D2]